MFTVIKQPAFTLIELLVVVTIIVVLISLLMPAMEKAIYQAELAVCGAKLKGIANGVTVYASEYKRYYPDRPWVQQASGWRPNALFYKLTYTYYDERKLIRPYIASINKQLQCPLVKELDLDDLDDMATTGKSNVSFTSYQLWYNWQYRNNSKGMRKTGDMFEYGSRRFSILASDYDLISLPQDGNFAVGSHPDHGSQAVMSEDVWDNKSYGANVAGMGVPGTIISFSRWSSGFSRGLIDMNFAHTDGSVRRLNDVIVADKNDVNAPDERMVRVPETSDDSQPTWRDHLPPDR